MNELEPAAVDSRDRALARSLKLRKTSLLGGMAGVAPASETQSFGTSEGRLYAAARSWAGASLLIASPLLYLIFVAIIAFRDRVRMNALMHQRVVALNLAPLSRGKFRFAKSKQYLAPSHPSSSIQSSSADVSHLQVVSHTTHDPV